MPTNAYSGIWRCTRWYPNKTDDVEESDTHDVTAEQTGKHVILQSVNDPTKSYLLIKLIIDGISASGSWTEHTTAHGDYNEMVYSGLVQLLVNDNGNEMTGKWVGIGRDNNNSRPDVYTGRWKLERIS